MDPKTIDALVAEHVFGWTRHEWHSVGFGAGRNWECSRCKVDIAWSPTHGSAWNPTPAPPFCEQKNFEDVYPPYSSDIGAAFQVMEKMRDRDWSVRIFLPTSYVPSSYTDLRPTCELISYNEPHTTMDGYPRPIKVTHNTLPEAICVAALKAVGVEVES